MLLSEVRPDVNRKISVTCVWMVLGLGHHDSEDGGFSINRIYAEIHLLGWPWVMPVTEYHLLGNVTTVVG